MLDGFITWLDSYISRERPSAVMRAMIGLMAFAGLLGTISGEQAIRAGAFVVVIVIAVSTMLALLADRRRLTRENGTTGVCSPATVTLSPRTALTRLFGSNTGGSMWRYGRMVTSRRR